MGEKLKLLWHSNAGWTPTGYGNQTGLFTPLLTDRYDVAISAFYGLEGAPIRDGNVPVFPGMGSDYGNLYLQQHARRWFGGDPRGGLVVTLMDVWVLESDMAARLNMACWVPVDHEPAPPAVVSFFARSAAVPIAMSRFGETQLRQAGLDPLYVPHGIDTDGLKPVDRAQARVEAGVPEDAFLVGMVAANKGRPSRKGFQQALEAFRVFLEDHDDAYLYLHTYLDPGVSAGEDLAGLITALGIPEDRVRIADQYRLMFDPYPTSSMAKIYSTMDVLVNPAMGEGFGIPVMEAQACGVPVVVTDFSAMAELCGSGWKVKWRPFWTGQKSWQAVADVPDIVSALEDCWGRSPQKRKKMADAARRHALGYSVPLVLKQHMVPALDRAWERFGDREPVRLRAAA